MPCFSQIFLDSGVYKFHCTQTNGMYSLCNVRGCMKDSNILCDYIVGKNQTCDKALCKKHAVEFKRGFHHCLDHHKMWLAEQKSNWRRKKH